MKQGGPGPARDRLGALGPRAAHLLTWPETRALQSLPATTLKTSRGQLF